MAYDRRSLKGKRRYDDRRRKQNKIEGERRSSPRRRIYTDRRISSDRRTSMRFPIVGDFVKNLNSPHSFIFDFLGQANKSFEMV